jgi:uncharacterized protein (DUF697 family)
VNKNRGSQASSGKLVVGKLALTIMLLNTVKQARAAFALLSPSEIRLCAAQLIHIGLVADGSSAYSEMEDFLIPAGVPPTVRMQLMQQVHRSSDPGVPQDVDLVLYEPGVPCPRSAYTFHRDDPEATVREVLKDKNALALPLARQFPVFRKAVLEDIIYSVAKENALFAMATALPNVVPNLLELPWVLGEFASDTMFLTANQVRMAFQMAAACGKEVGLSKQKAEIVTIAAGAFGWRALARELVSHIPMGGGLIPKGAIAYAGTFVTGKGLELWHLNNGLHTQEEQRNLYQEGFQRGRAISESLRLRKKQA